MSEHGVESVVQIPRGPLGTFILEVELRTPIEGRAHEALFVFVETWIALGSSGAFCVPQVRPDQSTMVLEQSRRLSEVAAEWRIAAEQSDPRSLRVLRNALVAFSQTTHPIRYIRIRVPNASNGSQPSELEPVRRQTEKLVYPEVSHELGFSVERRIPASYRSNRRLLVEFTTPPSNTQIDEISVLADRWTQIGLGGFPMDEADLDTGNGAIFEVETNLFDEYTVESVFTYFGASEAAWNPLLNALGWFHRVVQPLTYAVIY